MNPRPRHHYVWHVRADPHLWDQTDPDGSPRYYEVVDHPGRVLGYVSRWGRPDGAAAWSPSAVGRAGSGPLSPTLEAAAHWVATHALPG